MKKSIDQWMELHSKEVLPQEDERKRVSRVAALMIDKCKEAADKYNADLEVVLGGSFAHDTWLPGKVDVDIFLAFRSDEGREVLSTQGMKIAHDALAGYDIIVRYAEHPYLEGFVDGVRVNIVPCLKVKKGEWVSAADRSPYHTEFMNKILNEDMRLHIRLLKKLLQVQRLYGAEIKVKGFSGYVCEVLIARYKSLQELLKSASNWRYDSIISLEEAKNKAKGFAILDPVDENRNLAKAIAPWRIAEFIFLSRLIIRGTSCDPFQYAILRYPSIDEYMDLLDHVFVLTFTHRKEVEDTVWGELARSSSALVKHLEDTGFSILNYSYNSDLQKSAIAFLIPGYTKQNLTSRMGPEVHRVKETDEFIFNDKTITWFFTDDFRSRRIEYKRLKDINEAIEYFMDKPVERTGFSKGLAEGAKKSWKLLEGKEAIRINDEVVRDAVERVFGYSARVDQC